MKVIVEADGGSRGNPGPAGYGTVVWSADHGAVLAESKQSIGRATNNVAEYSGLIAGLEEAASSAPPTSTCRWTPSLWWNRCRAAGRSSIPISPYCINRRPRCPPDSTTSPTRWIPRSKNSHADRLANEAMDAAAEIETPPDVQKQAPNQSQASSPAGWTGARGAPTRFLLLRHGQTELSTQRRYSGRGNPPLTDVGRRQAEAAAQFVAQKGGIAAVITSPLQRAYDTATAAAKALGLDVGVDDDLIETDFGAWEGLTFGEAAERDPELHRRWLRDTSVTPPDGESFDRVADRVRRARARIINEHGGETVLVVSHVTPIKTFLRLALDAGQGILYRLHLDLASLSIAEFYPDGVASVRLVNQTAYL